MSNSINNNDYVSFDLVLPNKLQDFSSSSKYETYIEIKDEKLLFQYKVDLISQEAFSKKMEINFPEEYFNFIEKNIDGSNKAEITSLQ